MLRKILVPERDEVRWEWRKLHKEELYDLYSSTNVIRVMKSRITIWEGYVTRMGERRSACRVLVGKPV
jgi:hypothetical protein